MENVINIVDCPNPEEVLQASLAAIAEAKTVEESKFNKDNQTEILRLNDLACKRIIKIMDQMVKEEQYFDVRDYFEFSEIAWKLR